MLYNISYVDDPVEFFQAVNIITNGFFGPGIVLAFGLVMFLALKNWPTERAIAVSCLTSSVLCFFFFLISLTSMDNVLVASIASIASIFILNQNDNI